MGWFLSKTTKKKKKTTTRGAAESWDPARTLLGLKFAGIIAALVAAAIGWNWGEQELLAHARDHHAKTITAEDIVFSNQPPGIVPDKINNLRSGIAIRISADPTDGAGIRDAANWLRDNHDLVKTLHQLQRMPDGTIAVDLEFRHPAAIVRMANEITGQEATDGYHIIDAEGFQIYGPVWIADVDHLGLPQILGVPSANRPIGGTHDAQWKGNGIPAAMSLIEVLRENELLGLVESISVNNRDPRGRIRLVLTVLIRPTQDARIIPCQIIWGLPPNHNLASSAIEPAPAKKVQLLRALLASDEFKLGHRPESWLTADRIWSPQTIRPD